jgi:hypothetical protein
MQVEEVAGDSRMTVEFVNAADGSVTDSVSLTNTLRRDRKCTFCYSRSGGAAIQPFNDGPAVPAACSSDPRSDPDSDLHALAAARLSRERPAWARVLQEDLPAEWMSWAAEELDPDVPQSRRAAGALGSLAGTLGSLAGLPSQGLLSSAAELFALEDPDAHLP